MSGECENPYKKFTQIKKRRQNKNPAEMKYLFSGIQNFAGE